MSKTNFLLTMTKIEKQALQKIATKFGYNLSEYMRKKLFNENTDLASEENRYLSIHSDKHNMLSISMLYKILFFQRELLEKQDYTEDELTELEQNALEYCRKQRENHGYKIIEKSL
jgi:hypothetical protein